MTSASDTASAAPFAVALTVTYDGDGFSGFARQPGLRTVQGAVEAALSTALRREVETTGAGRTDAGVHALGQVMSFDGDVADPPLAQLRRSITALAGPGVVVREVRRARPGFSARFDAISREYRYRLVVGSVPPLFLAGRAWHVTGELDVAAMRAGLECLVGEHDFRSFCTAESAEGKRTVRRIDSIEIFAEEQLGEESLVVRIVGNAFLHSMVRIIIGTLVEVGQGRKSPEWVAEALAAQAREAAGPTAPPHGLTLWAVEYPGEVWLP